MAVAGWGMQSRAGCCSLCVALVLAHGAVCAHCCVPVQEEAVSRGFFWNENRRNAASKTLA